MPGVSTLQERLIIAFEQSQFSGEDNKSDLARCVGIKPQAVYQWFDGTTEPSAKNIFKAAQCLGVRVEWLASGSGPMLADRASVKKLNIGLDTARTVPIMEWDMAGNWQSVLDQPGSEEGRTKYITGGENTFALTVQGDSMVGPGRRAFHPGEIVHIDPDQTDVVPDDFILARLAESGQITLKQYKVESGSPYLAALNPHFPPIFQTFEIVGRVVAKIDLY